MEYAKHITSTEVAHVTDNHQIPNEIEQNDAHKTLSHLISSNRQTMLMDRARKQATFSTAELKYILHGG